MIGLLAATGLLLLIASALLSAFETACFKVGGSRIRTLVDEGFRGAEKLSQLRLEPTQVQTSYVLFNTLLNVGAAGLLIGAGAFNWGGLGAALAVPGAALAVLLLGELLPRVAARRRPVRLALASAPVLLRLERLARPLLSPVQQLERYWAEKSGDDGSTADEREVRELAELGQEEGVVVLEEHELVERAFRLDETAAWDVMTPRVSVFAWKDSLTLDQIVAELPSVPYSRVPVFSDSIDDVTGILYVREAYAAHVAGQTEATLSELSREPFFVPGSLPLTRLLRDFQSRRIHMGIVADEFGGTDGLVTLEDILEELVGEIVDETRRGGGPDRPVSPRHEIVVDGATELREINYAFNVSLPHLDHRSLNGFLLETLGHVPEVGEQASGGRRRDGDPRGFGDAGSPCAPSQASGIGRAAKRPGGSIGQMALILPFNSMTPQVADDAFLGADRRPHRQRDRGS